MSHEISAKSFAMTCLSVLAVLVVAVALVLFWIFGTTTYHASPKSIWWSERGQGLIPPTARDITLIQAPLDHDCTYTVAQQDLEFFLARRFPDMMHPQGTPLSEAKIGTTVGPFGFRLTKETVKYSGCATNGSMSVYFHDPATGFTYQDSAYW